MELPQIAEPGAQARGRALRPLLMWGLLAVAGFGLAALAVWRPSGSYGLRAAFARMTGRTVVLDSERKSFGIVAAGDPAAVSFRLTNWGDKPVRVVGYLTYCNCVSPNDLPFTLGPGEARDFVVSLRDSQPAGGGASQTLDQPLVLYTTNPAQAEIPLTIQGEIRRRPAARTSAR
jgi:hypothetical protein